MTRFISIFCAIFICSLALAHDETHGAVAMPKDFEKIKALVGQWEATSKEGGKDVVSNVTYEVTAGGTAVMERMFTGSPHEMVSIYHANDGKVAMTHFCMLGNHPEMTLKKASDKTMNFELQGATGLNKKNEAHMHSLTITVTDPNHVVEEWAMYDNGKKKESKVINLARK